MYIIDSTGTVYHLNAGPDYMYQEPQRLDRFIGCNEPDMIKLQFAQKWFWIIIVIGLILQLIICWVMFSLFARFSQTQIRYDADDDDIEDIAHHNNRSIVERKRRRSRSGISSSSSSTIS